MLAQPREPAALVPGLRPCAVDTRSKPWNVHGGAAVECRRCATAGQPSGNRASRLRPGRESTIQPPGCLGHRSRRRPGAQRSGLDADLRRSAGVAERLARACFSTTSAFVPKGRCAQVRSSRGGSGRTVLATTVRPAGDGTRENVAAGEVDPDSAASECSWRAPARQPDVLRGEGTSSSALILDVQRVRCAGEELYAGRPTVDLPPPDVAAMHRAARRRPPPTCSPTFRGLPGLRPAVTAAPAPTGTMPLRRCPPCGTINSRRNSTPPAANQRLLVSRYAC